MKAEEDKIQSESFQWLWNTHPLTRRLYWAIPNGGSRGGLTATKLKELLQLLISGDIGQAISMVRQAIAASGKIEGMRLKATGVVSGAPDTVLNIAGSLQGVRYSMCYIEFKTEIGTVSNEQKAMHEALKKAGHLVVVIRSVKEFQDFIRTYLAGSPYLVA